MSAIGKRVQFAIVTKESLEKCSKILQKVDVYIDGESGVPQEEEDIFEKYIKI